MHSSLSGLAYLGQTDRDSCRRGYLRCQSAIKKKVWGACVCVCVCEDCVFLSGSELRQRKAGRGGHDARPRPEALSAQATGTFCLQEGQICCCSCTI